MRSILPMFILALTTSVPALADAQTLPVPNFRSVELRGGGDLVIVPGPVQRVTIVEGSTQFTSVRMRRDEQLQIDACNARCPHNYRLRVRIESPRMPSVAGAPSTCALSMRRGWSRPCMREGTSMPGLAPA